MNDGAMYCEYCKDAGKNNAFTNGCLKFKKDALKKHVATVDHRVALAAKSGRKDMQRAISTVYWNGSTLYALLFVLVINFIG